MPFGRYFMNPAADVWSKVITLMQPDMTATTINTWFDDASAVALEDDRFVLYSPTRFKRDIIATRYVGKIQAALRELFSCDMDVVVLTEGELDQYSQPEKDNFFPGTEEYTFERFVVGSSNKFAHAASQAVASKPAGYYNPLFIYGGSGLGKTHLLYAIASEIKESRPKTNVIYVKGEEFTNELIAAIGNESTQDFHDKYRQADVLLVDDIQFIGGKESTQEEFFHTFDSLYQDNKQIVLTSDRPPKEIKTLEERLRTRFEWGLIADIQPPDFETRIAIIKRKAELLDLEIPSIVEEYIANHVKNNIRQLEGVVKKLNAYNKLAQTPPSILLAQSAIREILTDNQPIPVTVERIISEVGRTFGVSPEDIRSSKRSSQISNARQIAMYVIREITQMSMAAIGNEFGGRDHSTVVYATSQVVKNMKQDTKYKETVEDIIKNIRDS